MTMSDLATPSPPRRVQLAAHSHRILLYTTSYNVLDGVTLTIRKIEKELLAAGHHLLILTSDAGDRANTHLDGSHPNRQVLFLDNSRPIFFLHDPNNTNQTYHIGFSLSRKTRQLLDEFEPSLVHVTCPDCVCLNLIQYARQREIPLMGTYHSNIPEYMDHYPGVSWAKHVISAFFRHQYNFLQRLYVPTPYIQDFLAQSHQMDGVTDLHVWGRGIDLKKFSPSYRSMTFRQKLGIDDEDVVVCFVGRLVPEKRLDIFSNVVRRLRARNVPFHALVIGSGPMEEELRDLPNTTLCGWLDGQELSVAYASSDVFLFPSAVETFGNVTLEAAASGLPLVVEAGCSGHLVKHGVNGYACDADSADAFFEGTLRLVVNEEERMSFSLASREHSMQFEEQKVMRRMVENYAEVTDEFYCDYGGRHENRDKLLWKDESFRAGNYPRPMLLLCLERLIEMILLVMWHLTMIFFYFRDCLPGPPDVVTPPPRMAAATARKQQKQCPKMDPTSSHNPGEDSCGLLSEVTSPTELSSGSSDRSRSSLSRSADSAAPSKTCLDGQIPHSMAKGFVRIVEYQCLFESYLRSSLSSCSRPTLLFSRRGRKDSNLCERSRDQGLFDDGSIDVSSSSELSGLTLLDLESGRRPCAVRRSTSGTSPPQF